jgi:hypothetical protein
MQTAQILKRVYAGIVTIAPSRLQCVSSYHFESGQRETVGRIFNFRSQNISENVRLAAASGAGTRAPQKFQRQIRLGAVIPLNGKLVTDQLNIFRLKAHSNDGMSRAGKDQS